MAGIGFYKSTRPSLAKWSMFSDSYGYREDGTPRKTWQRDRKSAKDLFYGHSSDQTREDYVDSYRTGIADSDSIDKLLQENERRNAKVRGDSGHEFDLQRFSVKHHASHYVRIEGEFTDTAGRKTWGYKGPIGLYNKGFSYNDLNSFGGLGSNYFMSGPLTDVDIAMGAKAIAAVAPTKSEANVAASLLELKDGFPKMIGKSLRNDRGPGAVGSEYLNFVFGWLPTISDVKQIAVAMVNANKIITQYQRDADRLVRRRFRFPAENSMRSAVDSCYNYQIMVEPPPIGTSNNQIGYWGNAGFESNGGYDTTLVRRDQTWVWFSGAFRYHLAVGDDVFSRIERTGQIAAKWLGARADANAFWQAMPWSWFIDWFTDVGALVQNANAAALDGQVLQYGYLMKHTKITRTFTTNAQVTYRSNPYAQAQVIGNLSSSFVSERKQRIKATPYGFGINPDSFSAQQWAILGALGLTRAPNKLW